MPQIQELTPQRDYIAEGLGRAANKFGETMNTRQDQQMELDAVKKLVGKYKPGMTKNDFLRETLGSGGFPIEKRLGIFDAINQVEAQEREQTQKQEAKNLQEQAAVAASEQYGIPKEVALAMDPKSLASLIKESTKNQPISPEVAAQVQAFNADPQIQALDDLQYRNAAQLSGIPPKEIDKLVTTRQKAREIQNAQDLTPAQRMQYYMPQVAKIRENADLARKRINSQREFEKGFNQGGIGIDKARNFIASFLPESNPLGNLIRHPEDVAAELYSYQYLVGTKADFGVRLTDADVGIVNRKIVTRNDTKKSAALKFKFFDIQNRMDLAKEEEANKIIKKSGGIPPTDFEIQLSDALQKRTDLRDDYEKAARDLMSIDDNGKVHDVVWMIDPDDGTRHPIKRNAVKEMEAAGFEVE